MERVKIKTAKTAGFCFGVKRAIQLAEKTAKEKGKIYTFGPLIHNPQEVKRLANNEIKAVSSPARLKNSTLILRTHGIPLDYKEKLYSKKLNLVDATCPFVKRAQEIVKKLADKGSFTIIAGDKVHPEVVGLVSYAKGKCKVVEKPEDLKNIKLPESIGIVSQTTQSPENFKNIINIVKKSRPAAEVFNTICRATVDRQSEARNLAKSVDFMIVVGGKNSGNTRRLYEICRAYTKAAHIEHASEIKHSWFLGAKKIGLTAGASTPDWIIRDVKNTIKYKGETKWKSSKPRKKK